MATGKKLPSGSWRCQVFSHYEEIKQPDGTTKKKRVYKSFTSDDPTKQGKKDVELAAALYAADKKTPKKGSDMTFGNALDDYISKRSAVLSPRTIMDYKRTRKNDIQTLMNIRLCDLTQEDVQEAINLESVDHSPKTVRNTHGLISAVVRTYRPDMALHTDLPKRIRPDIYVPSDSDIQALISHVKGSDMELPILLAAFGPMRRGEICALHTKDIKGNVVHVCRNKVLNSDGSDWVIRQPKSYAGDRYIKYPDFVAELWSGKKGMLVGLSPNNLTNQFSDILKRINLPHFRFHDLRHYSASIQHAIGVPDSYIMQRGGWGNDGVLKAVYRHTMDSKAEEMNQLANKHFEALCNTKCNTKK